MIATGTWKRRRCLSAVAVDPDAGARMLAERQQLEDSSLDQGVVGVKTDHVAQFVIGKVREDRWKRHTVGPLHVVSLDRTVAHVDAADRAQLVPTAINEIQLVSDLVG